jgi:hypothetical protein
MSIFELLMLLCFGSAWPFSIARSWKTRSNKGKSVMFLWIVLTGYASGIMHKLVYNYNGVIWAYALNFVLVAIDIVLFYRNRRLSL